MTCPACGQEERQERSGREVGGAMATIIPAPAYVLACAAWVPMLVIWHADGRFTRLEGAPCEAYAARFNACSKVTTGSS